MRTRKEFEQILGKEHKTVMEWTSEHAVLEVLLDIRDLLEKKEYPLGSGGNL